MLALIGAGVLGYLIADVQFGVLTLAKTPPKVDVSYADVVTITLTVFGIFLALASIVLAVAAIVGWNSIEGKAMSVAESVTRARLDDESSSLHRIIKEAISDGDSPLHNTLKAEAQKAIYAGVQGMEGDGDELDDAVTGERTSGGKHAT